MKITGYQASIIVLVLKVDKENKQRTFPNTELGTALEIYKQIKQLISIEWDKQIFKEWEIKLNSEQKVFLTKLINDRDWSVDDAEEKITLIELLV